MEPFEGVTLAVLVERLKGVSDDVAELRQQHREDHHRLRTVEGSVTRMIDAQRIARESEAEQYRKVAQAIAFGGFVMAAALVALAVVTIVIHAG